MLHKKRTAPGKLLVILITGLMPAATWAQAHENAWFRATVGLRLQKQYKVSVELQHRRQNSMNNEDPFGAPLLYSARPWISYQATGDLEFSVSPLAWYQLNSIIRSEADVSKAPQTEYRTTIAAAARHRLDQHWTIAARIAGEYRSFDGSDDLIRTRTKLGADYRLGSKAKLYAYDELLINAWNVAPLHIFDHNRLAAGISYKTTPKLTVDVCYLRISRLPLTSSTMVRENNYCLQLGYDLN